MRQVVYALTGSESRPPILDRLLERFVERVRDDIEDLVWSGNFFSLAEGQALYKVFGGLSPHHHASFCLDPVVFDAICAAKSNTSAANLGRLITLAERAGSSHQDDNGFRLGGTIRVDLGSEYCATVNATSPVFMRPLDPLSDEERTIVEQKLGAAMAEIDATAPIFGRMIRNYTRTIFVRKIEGHAPASEQVDTECGAIRLRNVHSDLYTHDQLVDDLVHESTHGFLGTFEYCEFPFNPYGYRAEGWVRPVSPWSTRPIQVLPFIHACFVYFALYHYCEMRLRSGLADPEERQRLYKRQNRYASGFLMPGRLSEYVSTLALTDPRVLRAIDWIEQIMKGYYALEAVDVALGHNEGGRNEPEDLAA